MSTSEGLGQGGLQVGNVTIPSRAFLAPMSGVTDLSFRRLATRHGAGLVVSEMVAGACAARGSEEARLRAEGEGLPIHVVQIAGRDCEAMREGVRIAEAAGAHIIDINMGCPAKRVTNGYAGSALMREPQLAVRLIEATVTAARVPVTVKMRLGWDAARPNAPELARAAEKAGAAMVTVHGRTRCQFYNGMADWAAIRAVREVLSIPLVANGDLLRPEDAPAMLEASGADAVMIGRGACGRPWLVGQTAALLAGRPVPAAPAGETLRRHVLEHHELILRQHGVAAGMRRARKHLGWYLDALAVPVPASLRRALLTADEPQRVQALIAAAFAPASAACAA